MFSNRNRLYDLAALQPEARLLANVRDFCSANAVPANRAQEVINDIADVGVRSFKHFKRKGDSNSARFLRARFLKGNHWPSLHWARIRVRNLKTGIEELQWCAFILPHEYIDVLCRFGQADSLMTKDGLDPLAREHLEDCERAAQRPLLALGLWGDGVPCNWDRTESVETVSLNLPGRLARL